MQFHRDIDKVIRIAQVAGAAIMAIYDGDHDVEFKADDSPLTAADKAAHDVIVAGLHGHFPGIPVLSEEGGVVPYEVRRRWDRFWLVDPLDGTKEFIKRNGEFTVNIALIDHGRVKAAVQINHGFAAEIHAGRTAAVQIIVDGSDPNTARIILSHVVKIVGRYSDRLLIDREVRASNLAAQRLYASRGFHEVGRRTDYYKNPVEDALILRLDLP